MNFKDHIESISFSIIGFVLISVGIFCVYDGLSNEYPDREIPCYDRHNNVIKDNTCIEVDNTVGLGVSMIMIGVLVLLLVLYARAAIKLHDYTMIELNDLVSS